MIDIKKLMNEWLNYYKNDKVENFHLKFDLPNSNRPDEILFVEANIFYTLISNLKKEGWIQVEMYSEIKANIISGCSLNKPKHGYITLNLFLINHRYYTQAFFEPEIPF